MSLRRSLGGVVARAPFARALAPEVAGTGALGGLAGAFLLGVSATPARAPAGIALGSWIGWRTGLAMHERDRRRELDHARAALPETLDRLTICVLSGMSVGRALRTVAARTGGALGEALAYGVRALDAGVPRTRAYEMLAESCPLEELRALTAALARAERFGASAADTMLAQQPSCGHARAPPRRPRRGRRR